MKYTFKSPVKKPLLTQKHIQKRLEWCNKYINFNWDNVKFTDESSVWINNKEKRWVADNNDCDYCVKYPLKIHIWGSISINFKKEIYIFTENLTGLKYKDILANHMKNEKNFILQDDNDSKHRSQIVKKWKDDNKINSLDWPSNSPDLNPIENIWALLKHKLNKKISKNIAELEKNIILCWNEINDTHIKNTINSMNKRILKVIENKGYTINY